MDLDFGFAKAVITDVSFGDYKNKDGILFAKQIHSNIVKIVNSHESLECDGLITYAKGLKIGVYLADCMPIFIVDDVKKAICVLHSGRAGSFSDIFSSAIELLDSNVKDLKVYLGPSIKQCCYEVGDEIIKEAKFLGYDFATNDRYLDTLAIVKNSISKNKIDNNQVTIDDSCTCCDEKYYSYRRNGTSKRFAAYIWKI